MRRLYAGLAACALIAVAGATQAQPRQPDVSGRAQLTAWLDSLADAQLARRAEAIAALKTPADVERRKQAVRARILAPIGGLPSDDPAERGPLDVHDYGGFRADGFRVERITYDSLPGYHVTADVFTPEGKGPFPAVILAPGHGPDGKADDYAWGANLARAGILVLSYDIVGEGERWQHYDPQTGQSKAERATGEHSVDYWAVLPTGDHVARYFIADGIRGLDYLASRKDVDPQRLGAFGCSGGGTATAYLAALDDRVKVTAVACYINDYAHLLAGPGNQDAEQTLPWFLQDGLDIPDWAELAAPKPYAVVSTTGDMFPYAGAKAAVDEMRRIWGLYGAQDRLSWIVGPGPHGNLGPIAPQIVAFFTHWLKAGPAPASFTNDRPPRPEDILVTPTGQLSTSIGGEMLRDLNARRAAILDAAPAPLATRADLAALQQALPAEIRAITRARVQPGEPPPPVEVASQEQRPGYRLERLRITPEPGIQLAAALATPLSPGRKKALLLMSTHPLAPAAEAAQLERLTRQGWVVLALEPRGAGGTEGLKASILGDWNLLAARAFLVGKTPVGMRTDDAIRAIDWLVTQGEVDPHAISVYGVGAMGPVALHAAVLDRRIAAVWADSTVTRYREAVDLPLSRDMPEITPPGVLRQYDLPDLVAAISPRPVTLVSPVNGIGEPLRQAQFERVFAPQLDADRRLGTPGRLRWAPRGAHEPWPVLTPFPAS